jgi:hypothetical protein
MLRLEMLAYLDKSLEVSGAILAGGAENEGGRLSVLEPTGTARVGLDFVLLPLYAHSGTHKG